MRRSLLVPIFAGALSTAPTFAQAQAPRLAAGFRAIPVTQPSAPSTSGLAALVGGSDSCATPDSIVGTGLFAFDTTNATAGTEGQNQALCNQAGAGTTFRNDVWFAWTAPITGVARINTCGITGIDTKIAVYAGTGCPASPAIACNDDACIGYQSTLTWNAVAGQAYTIQLGLYPGSNPPATPGAGQFELQVSTAPLNDECATPTTILGLGSYPFDNIAATTGTQGQTQALCNLTGAGTAILQDVWYSWTSLTTGTVRISTCTSSVDTKIAVYAGSGCPVGTAIACNDDACGPVGWQSALTLNVTAGSTYTIQLGLYPGTAPVATPGVGTFQIVDATPPANDACSAATAISGPGPHGFDSTFATTSVQGQSEAACLFFGSSAVPFDQWFVWTPTATGTATLTTCGGAGLGASEDTKVAIYAGSGCPTAAAIACNDDDGACGALGFPSTVSWPVVCGVPYTIQIGRYPFNAQATFGTFTISVSGTTCVAGTPFCFGDGTGASCPCGNVGAPGNGCANSVAPAGARIAASGSTSLAQDTLLLAGSGMPNSTCLYFQGTSQLGGGFGVAFGDGLRCAGGTVVRLATKFNVAGASRYPEAGDPSVSVRGIVTAPGTRTYQLWYRNAAAFCTVSTFNLSNAVSVTWSS